MKKKYESRMMTVEDYLRILILMEDITVTGYL